MQVSLCLWAFGYYTSFLNRKSLGYPGDYVFCVTDLYSHLSNSLIRVNFTIKMSKIYIENKNFN